MFRKLFQHKIRKNSLKNQIFFDKDNLDQYTKETYLLQTRIETKEDRLKEDSVLLSSQKVLARTQEFQVPKRYFQHFKRDFINTTKMKWSE